ncbi:MAG TPA: dihydrodipicolinate synthase family protein [Nitrososphaerales archaeon]|nr:dihydrodipicolinate synthase family protein [Nitrososphaerales archaeon]
MYKDPHGVIPALVTPFTKSDEVDERGSRWLCRNAIDSGVHAVICVGSLGEFPCLTDEERDRVIRAVVDEANGKVPVIAGVGSASTKLAILLAKKAEDLGADAVEVLAPFYYNVRDEAVFAHYEKLAGSISLPVIIYNFPGTTKVTMSAALIARLAEIPNIIAIKNSVDSLIHLKQVIWGTRHLRNKPFTVLCGIEDYLIPGLLLGAKGTVSGFGNFIPKVLVQIYEACTKGKVTEASELYNRVVAPLKELAPPPEPIGALKAGASLVGPINTEVRLPLMDPPAGTRAKMRTILKKEGII